MGMMIIMMIFDHCYDDGHNDDGDDDI